MPKGATVRGILETFIKEELLKRGYQPVYTPHIGRLELYRTSGHFPYYRDAQFPPMYFCAVGRRPRPGPVSPGGRRARRQEEQAVAELHEAGQFQIPGYERGQTRRRSWRRSTARRCSCSQAWTSKLPEYDKATDARASGPRRC